MPASEKVLEKNLITFVKKLKGWCLKFWCQSFTGMPDRIILLPGGYLYFAEIKSEGKKLRPRQKIVIPMLRNLGFQVWIIDSIEVLVEFKANINYPDPELYYNHIIYSKKFFI